MNERSRRRLGRGIAALLGDTLDVKEDFPGESQRRVPIEALHPNPRNPRRSFAEEDLENLSRSIKDRGILQPILVRSVPHHAGSYEIIAGERRWRAAQLAQLSDVPILLHEVSDQEAFEIALVENVQRSDLNALEEAQGYEYLMSQFNYTQNDLARIIGKSRSHIANTLRLLKLPEGPKILLQEGQLSAGHARALLTAQDPERLAQEVLDHKLSVREVEERVQSEVARFNPESVSGSKTLSLPLRALANQLGEALGVEVVLKSKGESGEIRLKYEDQAQLEALCQRLVAG